MSSNNSTNEVEGKEVAENEKGKVSKETFQTAPQTDRQEDVDKSGPARKPPLEQQKEIAQEKLQKMLGEQIANLGKEIGEKEIVDGNAASKQEADTAEATAAEKADTDGNGQDPTPTSKTIEVLSLHSCSAAPISL